MPHAISLPHCPDCRAKDDLIRRLSWNPLLKMYRPAGIEDVIANLSPDQRYTIVLCDIDRMKAINSATGSHIQTDRYLAAGLRVRAGEIAGQLHDKGDEFVFILEEKAYAPRAAERRRSARADAFIARVRRQLAGQPLTNSERYALAAAHGCAVADARLSATFAAIAGVRAHDIPQAIEWLSSDVLAQKDARDEVTR